MEKLRVFDTQKVLSLWALIFSTNDYNHRTMQGLENNLKEQFAA